MKSKSWLLFFLILTFIGTPDRGSGPAAANSELLPNPGYDPLLLSDALIESEITIGQTESSVKDNLPNYHHLEGLRPVHDSSYLDQTGSLLPVGKKQRSEEINYSRITRDYLHHLPGYDETDAGTRNIDNGSYNLKLTESNIIGNTQFALSVAIAGDVNGDGYDDIIAGANDYYKAVGRSYIFFGGSDMDSIPDVILEGEQALDVFHESSGAGDVNGDGYDDVIVSSSTCDGNAGRSYIYFGGSDMDSVVDVTLYGESGWNYFGNSLAGAGDVNGDGYADVIVGARGYNMNTGRSYIFFGGSSMDNVPDLIFNGEDAENVFGSAVAGAGDLNGDGYADVIVGASGYNQAAGRSYIYYGGIDMDNDSDLTLDGETEGDGFGKSVAGAGDLNQDGYVDVIVGAPWYNDYTGRSYIYFGGDNPDSDFDLTLDGEGVLNYFGMSVAGAGDVNDDGCADVIVGAPWYIQATGRSYIYFGGSGMDPIADITLDGEGVLNYFGMSVAGAGDVNNDGYDEAIVGAPGFYNTTGRCYTYFGGSSMDSVIDLTFQGEYTWNMFGSSVAGDLDLNGDGYDDVIVGANGHHSYNGRVYVYFGDSDMDNTVDLMFENFGSLTTAAGDVNADGYDDILVGDHVYNSYTGRSYIFFGGGNMDDIVDVTFEGEMRDSYFGFSVAGAGDVNNDGYADVIVGAFLENDRTGRSYIFFGGSSMDDIADITLDGQEMWIDFGRTVAGAGDVNSDGYDDVIVGAPGFNDHT
ncbi:MAG: hypothetical protein GY869_26550, partial [Planctomycetes bacterium]|nr:hypothetical protein [Planctomycetota bacterium]